VNVLAGRFEANHYLLEQLTTGGTWFKKGEGHLTDFWVLDNGVLVRVLRHREPYEMELADWKVPETLPGLLAKGKGLAGRSSLLDATSDVPKGAAGPSKGALRFDGQDDFIHIPSAAPLDLSGNFTVSAWVRVDPGCGEAPIFFRGDKQTAHDPCQLLVLGRQMAFKMDGGQGQDRVVVGANLDGGWHLWTGVCDTEGKKLLLYQDGELAAETIAPPPIQYQTSAMYNEIGAIDSGAWGGTWGFFRGDVDRISVWNVARKPDDIKHEFTKGLKGNEPGLAALWTFDEDGQTVLDSSSNKCNATLGRTPEADSSDPARIPANAPPAPPSGDSLVNQMLGATNPAQSGGPAYVEPYALEGEFVAPLIRGEGVSVQSTESLGGTWSGGKILRVQPGKPTTYSLSLPAPAWAAHERTGMIWCSSGPDHGICELWINGELALEKDLYNAEGVVRTLIEAPIRIKEGANAFEFKITGKNPASSGYALGIDCVRLR
jgi:hypothetical protein